MKQKFEALKPLMNERMRRWWAATEATALGRGGVTAVAAATGISRLTITAGMAEQQRQATGEADASSRGIRQFDLGRSTPGSTVHVFKQRWGGTDVEVPYYFYPAPEARRRDMGLQKLKADDSWPQRVWSRLPLALCNRVGPLLRKQLPFI